MIPARTPIPGYSISKQFRNGRDKAEIHITSIVAGVIVEQAYHGAGEFS
jgi:hypothetical protein